ncbi:hypothetical protein NHH03_00555 [Stieleria sp. TO1_6]|uniref:hypothetical protein n=1 Tax=Stieleria tagensis TaxID=2956795 RepID=UPI00209AB8E4|nr:hypothetical protein [Stieleria tagensis]MCO8120211.1 hypothetical protein [Stieleria tagensis]
MSSNRAATPCDAVIYRDEKPVGPLRLPRLKKGSFIEEFNRLYRKSGMAIETNRNDATAEPPPASTGPPSIRQDTAR